MKLQKVNTFQVDVKFRLPGESPNSWRPVQFQATFKTLPEDVLEDLRVEQEETTGVRALLDRVLVDVSGVETDEKDEEGNVYTPIEIVKQNQFASSATVLAFWDAVNQDIKAKNSKRSRAR